MEKSQKKLQKGRVSLERALSKLGLASRGEAKELIQAGRVKVHGSVEKNPARQVNPDTAHVEVDGAKVTRAQKRLILFHKPKGVITTKSDPEGRKTIYDCLPAEFKTFHPVGRLDMNTTGLLLLTNDTKTSSFLTDPNNKIPRVYIAQVRGEMKDETAQKMKIGVKDQGELLRAEEVKILKQSAKESKIELVLFEGKNREVRRLCLSFGHEVSALKRVSFGPYSLGDLGLGAFTEVDLTKLI